METASVAAPPLPPPPPRPWRRRLLRAAVVLGVLAAVVAVLGFLVAPRLIRSALENDGSAFLRRRVTVAEVKVNPFTLTIDVNGLVVADRAAPRLVAWEELHVRLAPWRLLQGYAGVAEVRLTRPFIRAALDAQGRLNVQDLLDGDGSPPPPAPPGQARPRRLGVALDLLEVVEARVAFADATRRPEFESEAGPLSFRLEDFRTTGDSDSPYSLRGATEAGESFEWRGTIRSDPLRSAGTIAFKGLALPKYSPYQVDSAPGLLIERGTASIEAGYGLELGTGTPFFKVSDLRLLVEDLWLARRRDASRAAELPRLEVNGVDVDVLGKTASVTEVKVVGGRLTPRRERDGHFAMLDMLEPPPGPPGPPSPWRWSVAKVAVERLTVDVEDLMAPRPVRVALSGVNVSLTGLTQDPAVTCPLSASFRWEDQGTVSLAGTIRPFASSGELALEVADLDLRPVGPYADTASPLRLAAGTLGVKARASWDASRAATRWTFAGDVRVDDFTLRHPRRDEDLVRWRSLELLGVNASSARRASLRVIRLTEPRLRAVVFEDGTTGLASPAAPATGGDDGAPSGGGGGAEPAPSPAGPAEAARKAPAVPPPWRTSVGLLQVRRGRISLTDRSTQPPVHTALTDLEARIVDLSSDPRSRSTVEVSARVDGAGSVTASGTVNPLRQDAYTDLAIRSHAIDLTPLGPYAGKHVGYLIQKGKLDLELNWKVEERRLKSGNVIRFDQLTLGEETHSPEATSLPVRLLLAILTDKDGVILLDVPVDGDLDDPTFRLGRAIWHTLKSLLVKLAASPFSALAALAGGGQEDISLIEFAPGQAALDEAAHKRLDLLGKSLAARPALGLELSGATDPVRDGEALRRLELDRLLRRTKAAAQRPPIGEEAVTVAPDERPRWLAAAHAAAVPPPVGPAPGGRKGEAPPPPTDTAMEAALLGTVAFPPEALPALAAARARAARDALLAAGLDPARLFLVEGSDRARREPAPRAYFGVR
jgi:Domain of Unknown Function (DUF748)